MKHIFLSLLLTINLLSFGQSYLLPTNSSFKADSAFDETGTAIVYKPAKHEAHWEDGVGNRLTEEQAAVLLNKKTFYVSTRNQKKGIIANTGQVLIPFQYLYLSPTAWDSVWIARDSLNKMGLLTLRNEIILPFEYDYIARYDSFFHTKKQGKNALLNIKGESVLPPNTLDFYYYGHDYMFFRTEKEKGFLNTVTQKVALQVPLTGRESFKKNYDDKFEDIKIDVIGDDYFEVENEKGKHALYKDNQMILPYHYTQNILLKNGFAIVSENRTGLIDTNSNYTGEWWRRPQRNAPELMVTGSGINPTHCETVEPPIDTVYRQKYSIIRLWDKKIIFQDTGGHYFEVSPIFGGRMIVSTTIPSDNMTEEYYQDKELFQIIDTTGKVLLAPQVYEVKAFGQNLYGIAGKRGDTFFTPGSQKN